MSLEDDLSKIYGCRVEICGTYTSKDDRKRSIIKIDGKTTTRQHARLLLEQKLGRRLSRGETVDHVDEDKTNDEVSNLQPLSKSDNSKKSALFNQSHLNFPEITEEERRIRSERVRGENNPNSAIPDELVLHFRNLVASGKISANELADDFYLDRKTMRNLLTGVSFSYIEGKVPLENVRNRPHHLSEEQVSKIKELRDEGNSARSIGRIMGIHHSTVTKYW